MLKASGYGCSCSGWGRNELQGFHPTYVDLPFTFASASLLRRARQLALSKADAGGAKPGPESIAEQLIRRREEQTRAAAAAALAGESGGAGGLFPLAHGCLMGCVDADTTWGLSLAAVRLASPSSELPFPPQH